MNGVGAAQRFRIVRAVLLPVLALLGGCAIGGGCPISLHPDARPESRLEGATKTSLILKDAHYTIPPIPSHVLHRSFGCPVVPPDLVRAKPRSGK